MSSLEIWNWDTIYYGNRKFFKELGQLKLDMLFSSISSIENYVSGNLLNFLKSDIQNAFNLLINQILKEYNIELVHKSYQLTRNQIEAINNYHDNWIKQQEISINNLFKTFDKFINDLKELVFTENQDVVYNYILTFSKRNNINFSNSLNYLENEIKKKEIYNKQIDSYFNKIKEDIQNKISNVNKSNKDNLKIDAKTLNKLSKNFEKLSFKIINLVKKIDILKDSFNSLDFVNISLKENIKTKLEELNKNKEELIGKLNSISNNEINKNIKYLNELELFYKNLEFIYLEIRKLIKINIFHIDLNNKLNKLNDIINGKSNLEKSIVDKINNLINEINFLIRSDTINENTIEEFDNKYNYLMDNIYEFIYKEKVKQEMMGNLVESLNDLGYNILVTTSDGIIFLDSPLGVEYKIMLRIVKDKLAAKFIRIIEDNYIVSDTEKQRDIELVKNWCKDYQKVLNYLKENNIYLEPEKILNPEDDLNNLDIIYTQFSKLPIEVKELYSMQIQNKKKIIHKTKQIKQDYYQI